ncbi:endonuclease V isoform X4 [Corvus moneduloides]|uniref:endonuclease V isoform X4 n=1 Tax=Corvus moneduloides TaxID=1196302 RepID=UPI00136463F8|nr:endonuclease V isoform X4 [Corvus moneduloides]
MPVLPGWREWEVWIYPTSRATTAVPAPPWSCSASRLSSVPRFCLCLPQVLYQDCRMVAVSAPYVAGFLAFREVPFLVEAVQRLQQEEPQLQPQVLLVDGNGLLHPRGFGTACHLGVLTDLPCIGVAKNLLQVDGLVRDELHREQVRSLQRSGETFPLTGTSGKVLGMVLRSCNNSSKPLYVSVGHRVSLDTAVRLVRACCRFRIPEPIRQADIRSREYLRKQPCAPLEGLQALLAGPERWVCGQKGLCSWNELQ